MPRGSAPCFRHHCTSARASCSAPPPIRVGRFDGSVGGSQHGCRRCKCANANNVTCLPGTMHRVRVEQHDSPWPTGDGDGIAELFHRRDHVQFAHSPQPVGRRLPINIRIATAKLVTAWNEIQTAADLGCFIQHQQGRSHIRLGHAVIRPSPIILVPLPDLALDRCLEIALAVIDVEFVIAQKLLCRSEDAGQTRQYRKWQRRGRIARLMHTKHCADTAVFSFVTSAVSSRMTRPRSARNAAISLGSIRSRMVR